MKYKAIKDCIINGVVYTEGDEIEIATVEQLVKLNEKGFIKKLTLKEIQSFEKEKNKINKEEEI